MIIHDLMGVFTPENENVALTSKINKGITNRANNDDTE